MARAWKAPSRFDGVPVAGQRLSGAFRDRYQERATIEPWRQWYSLARWTAVPGGLRWRVLARDNFTCRMCGEIVTETSQLVADHIVPHRGDEALFWDDANLQCLCATCHSRHKQAEERRGA